MISTEVFMDILALHRQGHSMRWIAKKLGIHRNTVKKYITQKKQPKYQKQKRRESILSPYHQIIREWLDQDDFRATWIFDKLKDIGYTGGYDTVRYFVRNVKEQKAQTAYIRFETEPGRQAQMDWADFKVLNDDGSSFFVYLFLLVLGFSRAMFACFVDRCSLQSFMDSHIAGFHYLGGVPAEILYDNMRHVVIPNKAGPRYFNPEIVDFAAHYGFTPEACPAYSPWVKGKVERPIDYIRERFWRGYRFESIEKANADLRSWLDTVANQRIHHTYRQPVKERWQQELSLLGPMPAGDYDTSLKVFRTVYRDCQVSYNTNRFLLPHHVVGKRIMLKIKNGTIRFFHDDQLLATYQEPEGKHQMIGNRMFYEQLKRDHEQNKRKYGRKKGAATRGLINSSLFPQVMHRPLADYDRLAQGGASWNS
jgi:transposase